MSTLAERLAALKRPVSVPTIEIQGKDTDTQTIPAPVSSTVNVESVEESDIQPTHTLAETVSPTVNAVDTSEDIIREITEKAFGYAKDFNRIVEDSENIRKVIRANGFDNAYSVAEWQLMSAAFNNEMIKVSDMSITQIRYRIEGLLALITASKAMINACIETEKEKKKRETALERETREAMEGETYERDKKNNRLRKKANVDKHGAIVAAKTPVSERDKFIKKMVSKGMSNEAAEKLWDED